MRPISAVRFVIKSIQLWHWDKFYSSILRNWSRIPKKKYIDEKRDTEGTKEKTQEQDFNIFFKVSSPSSAVRFRRLLMAFPL